MNLKQKKNNIQTNRQRTVFRTGYREITLGYFRDIILNTKLFEKLQNEEKILSLKEINILFPPLV